MENIKPHIEVFESAHIYDNSDEYKPAADFREGRLHRLDPNIPAWLRAFVLQTDGKRGLVNCHRNSVILNALAPRRSPPAPKCASPVLLGQCHRNLGT